MNPRYLALLAKLKKTGVLSDGELRELTELDLQTRAQAVDEELEVRADPDKLELRDADPKRPDTVGVIVGRPAKFNVLSKDLGGWKERLRPGVFTRSLALDDDFHDVRALVGHDRNRVIGRKSAGTLEIRQDKTGLDITVFPINTTNGRDAYLDIKHRNLDAMSFGMKPRKTEWGRDTGGVVVRDLLDADLAEVSVVAWAQYPQTELSARALADLHEAAGAKPWKVALQRRRLNLELETRENYTGYTPGSSGSRYESENASDCAASASTKARGGKPEDHEAAAASHKKAQALHEKAAKDAPAYHEGRAKEHAALAKMHAAEAKK